MTATSRVTILAGLVSVVGCGNGFPILAADDDGTDAAGLDSAADAAGVDAAEAGSCKTVPPADICGLAPQCGCGPDGTCDVDYPTHSDGTTICVASTKKAGIASGCGTTSDCGVGLTCWSHVCRPYCPTVGLDCGIAGTGQCEQEYSETQAIPNATVCEISCALDDLYACGGGTNGCIWVGGDQTDCVDLSPYNQTSCSNQSPQCAPGYSCLQNDTCARWCQVSLDDCGALQCTPFDTPLIVHGVEYGVCQ